MNNEIKCKQDVKQTQKDDQKQINEALDQEQKQQLNWLNLVAVKQQKKQSGAKNWNEQKKSVSQYRQSYQCYFKDVLKIGNKNGDRVIVFDQETLKSLYEHKISYNHVTTNKQLSQSSLSEENTSNFLPYFHIQILTQTPNQNITTLLITFSYFTMQITILTMQTESCVNKQLNFIGNGSQGDAYMGRGLNGQNFVVKSRKLVNIAYGCDYFNEEVYQTNLKNSIIEYCIYKLCSALKIGPRVTSSVHFSFDMIVYPSTAEFCLQFCQKHTKISNILSRTNTLKSSLHLLHALNIIHGDIKPQNIMYSNYHKKLVFIDYGLARVIPQKIGQLSLVNYFGSLNYSSLQMKLAFYQINRKRLVDLYYNDLYGLQKSCDDMGNCIEAYRLEREFQIGRIMTEFQQKQYMASNKFNAQPTSFSTAYLNFLYNLLLLESIYTQNTQKFHEALKLSQPNYLPFPNHFPKQPKPTFTLTPQITKLFTILKPTKTLFLILKQIIKQITPSSLKSYSPSASNYPTHDEQQQLHKILKYYQQNCGISVEMVKGDGQNWRLDGVGGGNGKEKVRNMERKSNVSINVDMNSNNSNSNCNNMKRRIKNRYSMMKQLGIKFNDSPTKIPQQFQFGGVQIFVKHFFNQDIGLKSKQQKDALRQQLKLNNTQSNQSQSQYQQVLQLNKQSTWYKILHFINNLYTTPQQISELFAYLQQMLQIEQQNKHILNKNTNNNININDNDNNNNNNDIKTGLKSKYSKHRIKFEVIPLQCMIFKRAIKIREKVLDIYEIDIAKINEKIYHGVDSEKENKTIQIQKNKQYFKLTKQKQQNQSEQKQFMQNFKQKLNLLSILTLTKNRIPNLKNYKNQQIMQDQSQKLTNQLKKQLTSLNQANSFRILTQLYLSIIALDKNLDKINQRQYFLNKLTQKLNKFQPASKCALFRSLIKLELQQKLVTIKNNYELINFIKRSQIKLYNYCFCVEILSDFYLYNEGIGKLVDLEQFLIRRQGLDINEIEQYKKQQQKFLVQQRIKQINQVIQKYLKLYFQLRQNNKYGLSVLLKLKQYCQIRFKNDIGKQLQQIIITLTHQFYLKVKSNLSLHQFQSIYLILLNNQLTTTSSLSNLNPSSEQSLSLSHDFRQQLLQTRLQLIKRRKQQFKLFSNINSQLSQIIYQMKEIGLMVKYQIISKEKEKQIVQKMIECKNYGKKDRRQQMESEQFISERVSQIQAGLLAKNIICNIFNETSSDQPNKLQPIAQKLRKYLITMAHHTLTPSINVPHPSLSPFLIQQTTFYFLTTLIYYQRINQKPQHQLFTLLKQFTLISQKQDTKYFGYLELYLVVQRKLGLHGEEQVQELIRRVLQIFALEVEINWEFYRKFSELILSYIEILFTYYLLINPQLQVKLIYLILNLLVIASYCLPYCKSIFIRNKFHKKSLLTFQTMLSLNIQPYFSNSYEQFRNQITIFRLQQYFPSRKLAVSSYSLLKNKYQNRNKSNNTNFSLLTTLSQKTNIKLQKLRINKLTQVQLSTYAKFEHVNNKIFIRFQQLINQDKIQIDTDFGL